MSCSEYDWKAYALGELGAKDMRDAETHASACASCREELAGLRVTLDALSTLREEEIPRRIGFVSDKIFEPRWWDFFKHPSFAAACVLAAAILVHGFARPSLSNTEVQAKIDVAVDKAVARVEERQARELELVGKEWQLMYKQTYGLKNTEYERQ